MDYIGIIEYILWALINLILSSLDLFLQWFLPMHLGEHVGFLILKRYFPSWANLGGIIYGLFIDEDISLVDFVWLLLLIGLSLSIYFILAYLGALPHIEVLVPLQMLSIHLHNQTLYPIMSLTIFISGFVITLFRNRYNVVGKVGSWIKHRRSGQTTLDRWIRQKRG